MAKKKKKNSPSRYKERIAEINQMTQIEYIARIAELLDKYACQEGSNPPCTVISPEEFTELGYLQEHPQSADIQNQSEVAPNTLPGPVSSR